MSDPNREGPAPAAAADDERGAQANASWRAAIIWSLVLAVVALGGAWTVVNWRTLHLAYCKRFLASKDEARQIEGIEKVAARHLRPGLTRDEVSRLFTPMRFDGPFEGSPGDLRRSKTGAGFYLVHPISLDDGLALVFDPAGRLQKWWTVP